MIEEESLIYNNVTTKSKSNSNIKDLILAVAATSRITNQSMMIIDFDNHNVIFMSENMIYLNEVVKEDFKRRSANPYWSLVSEKVLNNLISIKKVYPIATNRIESDYSKHICVIDYPISIRGHEFYINQTFTPLLIRPDGITSIGIFTYRPSDKKEMSCILIEESDRRWKYDFQNKKFHMYDLNVHLSITEKEVLQRCRKGMTNKEIADDLFIACSTVKVHKYHIFKKLHVSTITEAMVIVSNYHLL